MIYNIYIFSKDGNLVFFHEWTGNASLYSRSIAKSLKSLSVDSTLGVRCEMQDRMETQSTSSEINNSVSENVQETSELVYGMIRSLKLVLQKLSDERETETLHSFSTNVYKLNHYESPTGVIIALLTDPLVGNIKDLLKQIYSQIYVEYVALNPLTDSNKMINCKLFNSNLQNLITNLPFFQV